jgi:hypothetical protein
LHRLVVGVPAADIDSIIVRLDSSPYSLVNLPTNYLAQLGPTFLFNLENVQAEQALHSIQPVHQELPVLLNIRHTIVNDIHIFTATFNDTIFASCHSVNWSQLPLPNDVSRNHASSVITLNPELEEALLIKDHTGDWGIVKFSQDLFTGSLEDANNEKNYQFSLYRFMPNGQIDEEIVYVDWEEDRWMIGSKNFSIYMNSWSISVKRVELANSMQYICLGATLIARFDALFTEIFGKIDETEGENQDGHDLLSNDISTIELNGSGTNVDGDGTGTAQKPNVAVSNV